VVRGLVSEYRQVEHARHRKILLGNRIHSQVNQINLVMCRSVCNVLRSGCRGEAVQPRKEK
jgi:hypothetical protein